MSGIPLWDVPIPSSRVLFQRVGRMGFDGNMTDDISNWLFPEKDVVFITDSAFDDLMRATVEGNTSWAIFWGAHL